MQSKGVHLKKNVRAELAKNEFFYFFTSGHTEYVLSGIAHADDTIVGGKIDRETVTMTRMVFKVSDLINVNGR